MSVEKSGLWKEYEQFSTAAEHLVSNSFQVPAVAIAIVTALSISGNVDLKHFGFGILIGVFLLSIWLGYYHSTLNTYGLHLVRIESELNSLDPDSPERLTYYTSHVGQEIIGTNVYGLLLVVLILVAFVVAIRNILTMGTAPWIIWVSSILFPLLSVLSFSNIVRTEIRVKRQKELILRNLTEKRG